MNDRYRKYIRTLLNSATQHAGENVDFHAVIDEPSHNLPVEHALWDAVCDPLFRSVIKPGDFRWRMEAADRLEAFADGLVDKDQRRELNPASSGQTVSDFLDDLVGHMARKEQPAPEWTPSEEDKENGSKKTKWHFNTPEDATRGFGVPDNGDWEGDDDCDSSMIQEMVSLLLRKSDKQSRKKEDKEEPDRDDKQDPEEENNEEDSQDLPQDGLSVGNGYGIGPGSATERRREENRFLRTLPKGLLKLAKLIGRTGDYGCKVGSFLSASKSDIEGITTGDSLSSLLPSEIAKLSCPATETVFYRDFVEKRLQVFASASSSTQPVRHHDGPVIICLDSSGSMTGWKTHAAMNLTKAVIIIAKRRRRDVLVINYSDNYDVFEVRNLARQEKELDRFICSGYYGGNDEDKMFSGLFEDILPSRKSFSTADILCITDFGWSWISDRTMALIEREKEKGMLIYGLNVEKIRDFEFSDDEQMSEVCDSLWHYDGKDCYEMPIRKPKKKPGPKGRRNRSGTGYKNKKGKTI